MTVIDGRYFVTIYHLPVTVRIYDSLYSTGRGGGGGGEARGKGRVSVNDALAYSEVAMGQTASYLSGGTGRAEQAGIKGAGCPTWQFVKSIEDAEAGLVHLNELVGVQLVDLMPATHSTTPFNTTSTPIPLTHTPRPSTRLQHQYL